MYSYFRGPVVTTAPSTVCYRYALADFEPEVRLDASVKSGDTIAIRHVAAPLAVVDVAKQLGVRPRALARLLEKEEGSFIRAGERIAGRSGFLRFGQREALAPVGGTVRAEILADGAVVLRPIDQPRPVTAFLPGRVTALDGAGITVETYGRVIHGIVGVGEPAHGLIHCEAPMAPSSAVTSTDNDGGRVLVLREALDAEAVLARAGGVTAVVAPSMTYAAFRQVRQHAPELTIVLTDGFGTSSMPDSIWSALAAANGSAVGVTGVTDVDSGKRPLVVIPERDGLRPAEVTSQDVPIPQVDVGVQVRSLVGIRLDTGTVTRYWPSPQGLASGYRRPSVDVALDGGSTVRLPTDNIEILHA